MKGYLWYPITLERTMTETKGAKSLGELGQEVSSGLAAMIIKETLESGKMVHIPSLGVVITPDGDMKEITELTEAELKANPHIPRVNK